MAECIFLIGNRGSGKTTVGLQLARDLGYGFVDLDQYLVERAGREIAEIVACDGWSGFRQMESVFLRQAVEEMAGNKVIATGGGIILSQDNCNYMQKHGKVIWLDVPLGAIRQRLALNPDVAKRPSLTGEKMLDELEQIYHARKPIYASVCTFRADGEKECGDICGEIEKMLVKNA